MFCLSDECVLFKAPLILFYKKKCAIFTCLMIFFVFLQAEKLGNN